MAALVLGAASVANAKNNAQVTITGTVSDVSCDITSGVKNGDVSLGNHKPDDFKPGAGSNSLLEGKFVIPGYETFSVGVGGCDGTVAAKKSLKLLVTGATIASTTDVFSDGQGNTQGFVPNAGVALTYKVGDSSTATEELLKKDSKIVLASSSDKDPKVEALNNKSVTFKAYMASVAEKPSPQQIHAPLNFSIAYE
ncbi:hypothetical protein CKY04_17590 [Photorhabdus sp. S8-52]|nr:hypothetical protein CKY03_17825 [Photorhabdus sp. S9-53]RAW95522.1 hypothetical protein CKY05_17615 [Photorhabdus sp. S10-54]RAW99681.1 hypothetical protein CKY04_17590 [Photorhabdus sp. S8-52]